MNFALPLTTTPTVSGSTFNVHQGLEDQLETASLALSLEAIRLSREAPSLFVKIPLDLNQKLTNEAILQHLAKVTDEVAKNALASLIGNQVTAFREYLQEINSPHRSFTFKLGVIRDANNSSPSDLKIEEDKIAGSFPISIAQLHGISLENNLDEGRLAYAGQSFHFVHSATKIPACQSISARSMENSTFVGVIQASYPRDPLEVFIDASF